MTEREVSNHIFLIGYRGAGKSTVGRLLSAALSRPFVDTDDLVELEAGGSIQEIFAAEGELGFRNRESQVLTRVSAVSVPQVVSLGGGAVLRVENQNLIEATGCAVWLRGSAERLFERITGDHNSKQRRPNLSSGGGYAEVREILAMREPIYGRLAQKTVETDGRTPDEIAWEIADWANSSDR